ncbi:hypothetical protein GCK32_017917 [Trichostrongylus colubriformis]|uniref:Uncharacterized protein n=1 Tax=Trichostrongylus colubriformis TaxID=6319 RepID=A0AAN8EU54_TRICO
MPLAKLMPVMDSHPADTTNTNLTPPNLPLLPKKPAHSLSSTAQDPATVTSESMLSASLVCRSPSRNSVSPLTSPMYSVTNQSMESSDSDGQHLPSTRLCHPCKICLAVLMLLSSPSGWTGS